VQKAFEVRFSAAEIGRLANVGELVQLIASKAQPGGAQSQRPTH
jgi:hypothetical protein